ncbi:MAG TPA: MaoC family dehydratase [Galbitalea sp.]
MTHYGSVAELEAAVGAPAQTSDWMTIDQDRINGFADATGDHQWIHVDPERAAAGPFGTTIAHGYLTLSMVSELMFGLTTLEGSPMVINYGLDKVRFLSVVPVDSRIRASAQISGVALAPQGVRVSTTVTVEIEGIEKPALIAETIALFILPA